MNSSSFVTHYDAILRKMEEVNPIQYGRTRNFLTGAVSYLSPYISRGVISTKQVLECMLQKGYELQQMESFVKELCWRDYFQRVGQHKNLLQDIKQKQDRVSNREIPSSVLHASTGIQGIDTALENLYKTGYMHNHARMYTAMLVCNIGQSHWENPSKWLYYHLLDGDWASNVCSWQWVAGANSSKKYYANQENINKYCATNQANTFLDMPYEVLEQMQTPSALLSTEKFEAETALPASDNMSINQALPTFIYNYYNLDPKWHEGEAGNRILVLEPSLFSQQPVSEKCIDFMLALATNIPNIHVFVGSFQSLVDTYKVTDVYFKEHPLNVGYVGTEETRDWIAESVTGYYPSFFAYWKKVEKQIFK